MQKARPLVFQGLCARLSPVGAGSWAKETLMTTAHRSPAGLWTLTAIIVLALGFVLGTWTSCAARDGQLRDAHDPRGEAPPKRLTAAAPAPQVLAHGDGQVRMTTRVDRTAVLAGSSGDLYVELALEAQAGSDVPRTPTDVVVVLDRSGSMEGHKLDYARRAAERLLGLLGEGDRFALVSYESSAEVVLPLWHATEKNRDRAVQRIRALTSAGSTNLSAGLDLALAQLSAEREPGRVRRVLLLSDGLANAGDDSPAGLRRRASSFARRGAVLTTMGIGDDFDEPLMTALADAGEGNFYYLAQLEALAAFFESEFVSAARTVASNLAVHFVPGAYVELVDAAGYPLERLAGETVFRPGSLSAGQRRSLWLSVRVPTDRQGSFDLGSVRLTYDERDGARELAARIAPRVECVSEQAAFERGIVKEVWEAAVSRDALSRTQRALADAVASGSEADVDRAAADYARNNQALADKLGSKVVQQSIADVQRGASAAKQAQRAGSEERERSGKRLRARSTFLNRSDAYSADPLMGM
jgi:Ca-activated chloride channel family protein